MEGIAPKTGGHKRGRLEIGVEKMLKENVDDSANARMESESDWRQSSDLCTWRIRRHCASFCATKQAFYIRKQTEGERKSEGNMARMAAHRV